ncbi:MAG: hypothetical protein KGL57_11625 [Burkholderiales bacterium]|nr:hypothetical protein [Burkholderiales bacterium]
MRWRLLRRRLSISAPRMAVRSHLPWPLRWALAALMLGFSAALALWAFEVGRGIAGLPQLTHQANQTVELLQTQLSEVRADRDRAQSIANTADSLLKTERVTQQKLAEQVKQLEASNQTLKDDLGFFERLLPATGEGISVRALQIEMADAGQARYQLLVMQQGGRVQPEFRGHFELTANGLLDGRPWTESTPLVKQALQFKQYQRVDGILPVPPKVQLKQVFVRVLDDRGVLRASQTQRL